jgi:ADP-ribosylglycohydrolase
MITRAEFLRDRQAVEDKAMGSLLGLAVGDAMGDLGRSDEYRKRHGLVTQLDGEGKSTDDTEFAILTARTLIDCQGALTPDALVCAWQKYILAQGGMFERGGQPLYGAVANLRRGLKPPLSGRDNVAHYDDGAAMRIAPIGILCAGDPARAAALAEIDAQISHSADGIWAAQAVAASVAVAMVGASVDEIVQAGRAQIPADSWLGRALQRALRICDEEETIENAWERLHAELWTPSHSASPEAVPQVYALFRLTQGDFKRGMFWACNFGRDADTLGAVIGAITGARHGVQAIPTDWIDAVRRPRGVCLKFSANEDIVDLAKQLAGLIR